MNDAGKIGPKETRGYAIMRCDRCGFTASETCKGPGPVGQRAAEDVLAGHFTRIGYMLPRHLVCLGVVHIYWMNP